MLNMRVMLNMRQETGARGKDDVTSGATISYLTCACAQQGYVSVKCTSLSKTLVWF
jgi:hypothetical protein